MKEGQPTMTFAAGDGQPVVARSAAEVAKAGVMMYPEALNRVFGQGAANEYRQAMGYAAPAKPVAKFPFL